MSLNGVVVAYQADDIAPATRLGWSVVATGYCHLVTDPEQVARYQAMRSHGRTGTWTRSYASTST